jgi:DNA-binding response OmpR family regulator
MACILVLSDAAGLREALRAVLVELGHTVVAGPLTHRSPQTNHSQSPQVVLVDLPGFAEQADGVIAVLRRLYPTAKFIALFGGGSGNPTWLAQLWGVDACFFKPFDLDALLAAVHQGPLPVAQETAG